MKYWLNLTMFNIYKRFVSNFTWSNLSYNNQYSRICTNLFPFHQICFSKYKFQDSTKNQGDKWQKYFLNIKIYTTKLHISIFVNFFQTLYYNITCKTKINPVNINFNKTIGFDRKKKNIALSKFVLKHEISTIFQVLKSFYQREFYLFVSHKFILYLYVYSIMKSIIKHIKHSIWMHNMHYYH